MSCTLNTVTAGTWAMLLPYLQYTAATGLHFLSLFEIQNFPYYAVCSIDMLTDSAIVLLEKFSEDQNKLSVWSPQHNRHQKHGWSQQGFSVDPVLVFHSEFTYLLWMRSFCLQNTQSFRIYHRIWGNKSSIFTLTTAMYLNVYFLQTHKTFTDWNQQLCGRIHHSSLLALCLALRTKRKRATLVPIAVLLPTQPSPTLSLTLPTFPNPNPPSLP